MILINKKNWLLLLYYYLAACAMFVLSIVGRYFSFIVYSIRLAPRTDTNISDFVCLCALCSHCQIGIGLCKDHREININIHSDCNDRRSCWKIGLYNLITVYVRRCGLRLRLLSAHFPCIRVRAYVVWWFFLSLGTVSDLIGRSARVGRQHHWTIPFFSMMGDVVCACSRADLNVNHPIDVDFFGNYY